MLNCILFVVVVYELPLAVQSQRNLILKRLPQHEGGIFSTSHSFSKGTRDTEDYSILALEAIGFFPRVAANISSTQVQKK